MYKYVVTTEHPDRGVERHEIEHNRLDDMGYVLDKLHERTGLMEHMISCEVYDSEGKLLHGVERVDRDDELHSFVDLIGLTEEGKFAVKMDNPREAILAHALLAAVNQIVTEQHGHTADEEPECVMNIIDNLLYEAEDVHHDMALEMMTRNREEDGDWKADFGGPVS